MRFCTKMLMLVALSGPAVAGDPLSIGSPGFAPSQVNDLGQLVEDWGTVDVRLQGERVADADLQVTSCQLADVIPAVCALSNHGAVEMRRTLYRAPIFPAGVDVLHVKLTELQGKPLDLLFSLETSTGTQLGQRTARIGGRTVLVLPREVVDARPQLEWGYSDEAVALPGWGKPNGECDAAFCNIRAGLSGVPIVYRFAVPAGSSATVVLGLCESHWNTAGQRPLRCRAEGAAEQVVDPVGKWGQHQPGLLVFQGRDEDGDGRLSVIVRPAAQAPDQNPILNVIWIFAAGDTPAPEKILAGQLNDTALYYVDVGGPKDQSIYPPGHMEFPLHLKAGDTQEMTFLVACPGAEAPVPGRSAWSSDKLLRAARDVWRDWPHP
ncbi:MAG: hypothetical protein ACYC0X_09770 [Pirellulaceae bacterium]